MPAPHRPDIPHEQQCPHRTVDEIEEELRPTEVRFEKRCRAEGQENEERRKGDEGDGHGNRHLSSGQRLFVFSDRLLSRPRKRTESQRERLAEHHDAANERDTSEARP